MAIAKPVPILLATSPDWPCLLDRHDTPWNPSVCLFRLAVPRQWPDVLAQVAAAVRELPEVERRPSA